MYAWPEMNAHSNKNGVMAKPKNIRRVGGGALGRLASNENEQRNARDGVLIGGSSFLSKLDT
jgi:hypothetical protein